MDEHYQLILEIVAQNNSTIEIELLRNLFWKRVNGDKKLSCKQRKFGEKLTLLFLEGLIQKDEKGYYLTKIGKKELGT